MIASSTYKRQSDDAARYALWALVVLLVLLILVAGLFFGWTVVNLAQGGYEGRVYPNTYVLGLNLGGLTPDAARAALEIEQESRRGAMGQIVLRDGENRRTVSWDEAGIRLDVNATVQAALAAGHSNPTIWLVPRSVAPIYVVDAAQARALLERLAAQVNRPAVDASLQLEGDRLVAVPGQAGRELDVEASLGALLVGSSRGEVDLVFQTVLPAIEDALPAQAQAEAILARLLSLSAYDVLSGETFAWTLGRETVVDWLRVAPAPDGGGLSVQIDPAAVQSTLSGLAATLGDGRGLRLEEAAGQVVAGLEADGGEIRLYMTHPARTYTVQAGDTIGSVAARFGMPPGLVMEANPGIDLNLLSVGQPLAIPSQDVLTPYLPVAGKEIVVSVAEQRMRVYENGALRYDWPVSTGVADSPTSTGVFQILSKEENAYASRWNLWMPHFMAVYRAGGDFYNGIHALPILSSGRRLWEGSLGRPASYGCIILGVDEAQTLFEWAEVGVLVTIE